MSDGPWQTLMMSREWRRVARPAEIDASSPDEVARSIKEALTGDFRKIPVEIITILRKAFGDGRQQRLCLDGHQKLTALRSRADGSPLGALLLSNASVVASEGYQGQSALREAVIRTLRERVIHGGRQVEEHYYREAATGRAAATRRMINVAAQLIDWAGFADRLLGVGAMPTRRATAKFTGVDEGPSF